MLKRAFTAASVALALSMMVVPTSLACLHSMKVHRKSKGADALVAKAEQHLKRAKLTRAARAAQKALRALDSSQKGRLAGTLRERAERVLAVVTVRRDGKIKLRGKRARSAKQRRANISWAIAVLQAQLQKSPSNGLVTITLAEALASRSSGQSKALKMLRALAERDLMTDARGYAIYAKLLDASGRLDARDEAVAACQRMARSASLCPTFAVQVSRR